MRRTKSTAVQSTLFISALIHGALVVLLYWLTQPLEPMTHPESNMDVFSISEQELAALEIKSPEDAGSFVNDKHSLSEAQVTELPRDRETLPEYTPSPEAVADFSGQIVELADPARLQEAPPDADYLSRANHRVDKETANFQFRINPDVVAPTLADEYSQAHEEAGDTKARLEGDRHMQRGATPAPAARRVAKVTPPSLEPGKILKESLKEMFSEAVTKTVAEASPSSDASDVKGGEGRLETPLVASSELNEVKREAPKKVLDQLLPSHPTLAHLDPKWIPQMSLSPAESELVLEKEGDQRGLSAGVTDARAVASLTHSARVGVGQGGGDGGTAPLTLQQGELKGAPSNDRLREKRGNATMLNSREFKYYSYMEQIKRRVNFYWDQALNNITNVGPELERARRNEFTTVVNVMIDREGNLKSVSLVLSCGIRNFDEATLQAFRIAAPFPPPPAGLLNGGDYADLRDLRYTVMITSEEPRYSGIDPRAHVMFPGIYRNQ